MGLLVAARPDSVNGVTKSKFTASRNPILYRIRRSDNTYTQLNNNGGFVEVQFNGINLLSYYPTITANFYLYSADNSLYRNACSTGATSSFSGGNTKILTTIPYVGASTSGYFNNNNQRTDWKVEVEPFGVVSGASLAGITFGYSPDPITGEAIIDISDIIRQFPYADWSLPPSLEEVEANTAFEFYIKYQEYYGGALQGSVQNDSANTFVAVHSAMQIYYLRQTYGHGGNLLDYVPSDNTRKWLTRFVQGSLKKLRMWRSWPFTLSFLNPGNLVLTRRIRSYDYAGILDNTKNIFFSRTLLEARPSVCRFLLENPSVYPFVSFADEDIKYAEVDITKANATTMPAPSTWTNLVGSFDTKNATQFIEAVTSATNSVSAYTAISMSVGHFMRVRYTVTISGTWTPSGLGISVNAQLTTSGGTDVGSNVGTDVAIFSANGTYVVEAILENVTSPAQRLVMVLTEGVASGTANVTITMDSNYYIDAGDKVLETLRVDIESASDNPLYLQWKNSLGGDSFRMFDANQEYNVKLESGKKATRMLLMAHSLDLVEWEAINEMNSIEEIFRNQITELSSAVVKTHSQINQQVYIVDASGNKLGVVVTPRSPKTETRQGRHNIEIEIELPEVQ